MFNDPLVEEIHAIRKKIWEECGCDFHKLAEYYMKLQEQHPERLVREVPKTEERSAVAKD
jgi:hypothetical protein